MPSIVTHYLFSEDVLNNAPQEIKKKLNSKLDTYHIFAQSFDNLFYYNLLTPKKGKEIRQFGNKAQRIKVQEYFKNIILEIKKKKLENNSEILAYLYGSLTHYILDSNCHPFIIFYAGWLDETNPNLKYRGNHEKIETNIDSILLHEKQKRQLYKTNMSNLLLPKISFSKTLKEVINNVCEITFNKKNIGDIYEKSTKQGHFILKYFVTDHHGLKKASYKIFDTIFYKNKIKYQNLSFYIKHPNIDYLNRKHELWCNPVNNNLKSNESFDDLYQKSLKEAENIFKITKKILENQINLQDYLNELGNKSYTTGLDCNQKENYQFFKN